MRARHAPLLALCLALASCGRLGCAEPPAAPERVDAPLPAPAPAVAVTAPAAPVPWADERARAIRQANRGDTEGAIAALESLLALFPAADEVKDDLAILLGNRAIKELGEERFAAAERTVLRGLALRPRDTRLKELGTVARYRQAMATESQNLRRGFLESALELSPTHAPSLLALARVFEEENLLEDALSTLERAKAADPEHDGLDDKIARLKRQASVEGEFKTVRSPHFVARFEGYADEALAYAALEVLEQAYFAIDGSLGLRPDETITVVIYTGGRYREATDVPDWTAGLYDGKIRVRESDLLEEKGHLTDVLFHEYTHAALARTVRAPLPAWFHEGLASLMEPGKAHDDSDLLRRARDDDDLLPLDVLERSFTALAAREDAALAYAEARGLVGLLLDEQGVYRVSRVLARVAEGEVFARALEEGVYLSPDALFRRWADTLQ